MDDDGPNKEEESSDCIFNAWDVFQPIWIRRNIQNDTRFYRFLLEYCGNFLPYCGIIFWVIFLFFRN